MNKTDNYFIPARQNGKTERERKVIFEITGDGLTAEEVGRIRQVIRHLNYKRGRRKAPRLFYQVFNYSGGRRSRTPTRPHYHDRAGDKPGRIRRIVDKRGKIQPPPHKAGQRLSSFGRCYIHDEQPEGEEKMERFKEPCKTERTYQKLFKVQKKDR